MLFLPLTVSLLHTQRLTWKDSSGRDLANELLLLETAFDFKQLGVWVAELEYAANQPSTGRNCKVIIILKEIKMKKESGDVKISTLRNKSSKRILPEGLRFYKEPFVLGRTPWLGAR